MTSSDGRSMLISIGSLVEMFRTRPGIGVAQSFSCSSAQDSEAPVVSAAAPTESTSIATPKKVRQCKVVRYPAAKLYMHDFCKRRQVYGPASLARGPSRQSKTVMVVGGDAVTREWDFNTGKIVAEHATGHCNTVSCFRALQGDNFLDTQLESTGDGADHKMSGTITTSLGRYCSHANVGSKILW
jgi:hypothetical protein